MPVPASLDYSTAPTLLDRLQYTYDDPIFGRHSVDTANQAQLAQYNNEYNYWLWKQQAEYNSPKSQVSRLKEAGLNPNFNAIEGTGNLTGMPQSQASLSPVMGSNGLQRAATAISLISSIFGNVKNLSSAFKNFAGTPSGVKQVRNMLRMSLQADTENKMEKRMAAQYANMITEMLYGVERSSDSEGNPMIGLSEDSPFMRRYGAHTRSIEAQEAVAKVTAALKNYDLKNLAPEELKKLKAEISNITASTGLRENQMRWQNAQNGSALILGFLSTIAKFL